MSVSEHPLFESNFVHLSANLFDDLVELAFGYLIPPVSAMKHRQVCHEMLHHCPIVDAPQNHHIHVRSAGSWHTWVWRRRTSGVEACTSNSRRVCAYVASTCRMRRSLLYNKASPKLRSQTVGYMFPKVLIFGVDLPH